MGNETKEAIKSIADNIKLKKFEDIFVSCCGVDTLDEAILFAPMMAYRNFMIEYLNYRGIPTTHKISHIDLLTKFYNEFARGEKLPLSNNWYGECDSFQNADPYDMKNGIIRGMVGSCNDFSLKKIGKGVKNIGKKVAQVSTVSTGAVIGAVGGAVKGVAQGKGNLASRVLGGVGGLVKGGVRGGKAGVSINKRFGLAPSSTKELVENPELKSIALQPAGEVSTRRKIPFMDRIINDTRAKNLSNEENQTAEPNAFEKNKMLFLIGGAVALFFILKK